ncbi:MAG: dethiobiotin synthase [Gammaproteobacteria bacterium]|nr:dethiobiotin synthase [Gammaproteobacteria bacterium]
MKGLFITGTDTDVGKTHVACAIVVALNKQGLRTSVMKPVASGCVQTSDGLRNKDALKLMSVASVKQTYEQVNPYAFEPAIAPHLAAQQIGIDIQLDEIEKQYFKTAINADVCVVEGVGGWMVPLNDEETMADLNVRLQLPIILVVGMKLGCINHALLTIEQIEREALPILGWVANHVDPNMHQAQENIQALEQRIPYPLLGVIPNKKNTSAEDVSLCLQIPAL